MKSTFLSRFTPSLMAPEILEAIFVQRHHLADYLVELICESTLTANKHFRLLVGMRGIGKTHLIALIYHRVSKMEDLSNKLLIAWLREEEWGVTSFLDLLLRIFRALQKEYPAEYDVKLNQQVEALYQLSAEEAEYQAAKLLREFVGNRTLLLLMENLDDVFNGLGDIGQKQLRAYIQNYSFLTILATAQSLFDGVIRKDDPFYNFFCPHQLEELSLDEAVDLLKHIAELEEDSELKDFIITLTGRDRIKAVHHLAGGNPRVYVIFSQFLTRKSLDELVEPFMRMLDDLTPYYQARMSWLSQQQRKIIEFLIDRRRAVTVKEIAQRCFITHQTASSQLKDLREKGYVYSESIGRESFYELREPLMRFSLEVKKQRDEPIRLFVDFLRIWYTRTELEQRLRQGIDEHGNNRWTDELEQQLNKARIDGFPYAQNHSKYEQHLKSLPSDAALEREYILHALQTMEDGDEDPRIGAYCQEYKNYYEKKDYVSALQVADKRIVLDSMSAEAWGKRGDVLDKLQRDEEALASYDKAIELDPSYKWIWTLRGCALDKLQRYDEALASYDKAIELDPSDKWAWALRGCMLDKLQCDDEALASYNKAIELDLHNKWVWTLRGCMLDKLQRYEEALASYDKVIELELNNEWAWNQRGNVLDKLQRYDEALASYDKAIELEPSYKWAWSHRTELLTKLQRYDEALSSVDKVIELDPNFGWAWGKCGDVLGELQRYDEALASLDKAIELDPSFEWAWGERGNVLSKLQCYEEALASLNKAIELDPSYRWAWLMRTVIQYYLGLYEEALASINKLFELDPNNKGWYAKGILLKNLNRFLEALTSLDKAIELDPNNKWAWGERGDVLGKLQRYEEALASLDKAIELDPSYNSAWGLRSWLMNILGHHEEALASCDQAIELDNEYSSVFLNRAIAILGLNHWEEGITALEYALERIKSTDDVDVRDAELIFRNLFNSTNDAAVWKTRIKTLIELYDRYELASVLAQGLVRQQNIQALMSEMVSNKAAQSWLEVWREVVGSRPEFQISLRLLNAAVRYRQTKGDRRVLLELPIEERKLLQEVLRIEESSSQNNKPNP